MCPCVPNNDDADVDAAVQGAVFGGFFNSGQVCAAASRFYVHESIYDDFAAKFVEAAKVGAVWINEHLIIFCDTPLGECKASGWGKDLSKMVLEEYTSTKQIDVDLTGQAEKPWYGILK